MGSGLMYRSGWYQSMVVPPWQRTLTLILNLKVIRVTAGGASTSSADTRKGSCGRGSVPSSSSVVQVVTFHNFLFCNCKQNTKPSMDHHPIIWKVATELLAKGTNEPSTDGVVLLQCVCGS